MKKDRNNKKDEDSSIGRSVLTGIRQESHPRNTGAPSIEFGQHGQVSPDHPTMPILRLTRHKATQRLMRSPF